MCIPPNRPITIFTPSFADENNTNAQNLTVKEIVARLSPEQFAVTMLSVGQPDPRIAGRTNTKLLPYYGHGNTAHLLLRSLLNRPDIYFYPRCGALDRAWLAVKKRFGWRTSVVTHVVSSVASMPDGNSVGPSILQADAVFANSTFVAATVRQRFAVDARTIYNGIDRRFFFPGARNEVDVRIKVLYAGSLQSHKRPEIVIQTAAKFPDAIFFLAGKGPCDTACRKLAAELGCQNVVFLGHLSQAQLGEEMRRSDLFLFPSIDEGHPQVLGQAAACGLPAIAMNSYCPEYVVNGQTGFLLESDAEITSQLALLLTNSGLRRSMSLAAIRHSQKFDWDQIAAQWSAVFAEVAGRSLN
jgi:glycosyltransferase involved in cell wall biosynthesis